MKISQSLTQTLKKSELTPLITDSAEVILDSACNSDIIKNIPVFGDAFKVYSIVSSVRSSLFQKQLYAFLYELKDIPPKVREKLIKKLESKKGFSQSFGEELIIMMDQFANVRKSRISARFFLNLLREEIDIETFRRLAYILNNIFDGDIDNLRMFYDGEKINQFSQDALINLGLISTQDKSLEMGKFAGGINGMVVSKAIPNDLGTLFVEMIQYVK